MTTPTTKEAMQAALKALEALTSAASPHDSNKGRSNEGRWVTINAPRSLVDAAAVALTLLRSALEEGPKQEPDADAAIKYGKERWGYKQGTKECIAFYRGACWQILSTPNPAASPLAADTQDKRAAEAVPGAAAVQPWEVKVHCSKGERTLRAGMQWKDALHGGTWEVVEPEGGRIYSPSGLGGTPTFWCKPVGELPDGAKGYLAHARDDGCVSFCGDSIAAMLIDADGVEGRKP